MCALECQEAVPPPSLDPECTHETEPSQPSCSSERINDFFQAPEFWDGWLYSIMAVVADTFAHRLTFFHNIVSFEN